VELGLASRKEYRLRVFENGGLRKVLEPKMYEVPKGRRNLHNDKLHGLWSSPYIIKVVKSKKLRKAGRVARTGEQRNAYRPLVEKCEKSTQFGRPRRK
jgi:hypothetical protein